MKHEQTIEIGGRPVTIETGRIARQASGAVVVTQGKTVVLVTAVGDTDVREGIGFFPLTVEYREQTAAVGKIPGGFLKREGRITDHEVLTSRLIDRTIRPMFPDGYRNEVQVIATVLGAEPDCEPAPLAILGAAAALQLSDVPFSGPVGGLSVARTGGQLVALPNAAERNAADLSMTISGTRDGLVMVEGGLDIVPEDAVLDALDFGAAALAPFFDALDDLVAKAGKAKRVFEAPSGDHAELGAVREHGGAAVREALEIPAKHERKDRLGELKAAAVEALAADDEEKAAQVKEAFSELVYKTVREVTIGDGRRIGGRGNEDIREITGDVGWLPTNHGSAIFTRGETQALVSCTLGTGEDQQREDKLFGEETNRFLLHYNFPPYSVGETRPIRGPGRREIGHGALARRALLPVIPEFADFPYTLRLISNITESNGSSSMATVCGSAMAMMDAGVPIKAPVAGIAMGMLSDGETIAVLSDILGDEDHLGDMDFKVTGTEEGVTALQLDNKIGALPRDVLAAALEQAKRGRLHILERMKAVIPGPREELPSQAPRVESMRIRPERIRDLIGQRGATIQQIQSETETRISVDDTGQVLIYSANGENATRARRWVDWVAGDPEVDRYYEGKVVKAMAFGAFVKILANTEGLVHISELAEERVEETTDVVKEGQTVVVKLLGVTDQGKLRLSMKDAIGAGDRPDVVRAP